MTCEQAIACIQDDELVEVTPQSVRLRKRCLDPHERREGVEKGRGLDRPLLTDRRSSSSRIRRLVSPDRLLMRPIPTANVLRGSRQGGRS